jgi:hypothetical protein
VRAEIIEDDDLTVPLVIPRQKGETELAIRETTIAVRQPKRDAHRFGSGRTLQGFARAIPCSAVAQQRQKINPE